MLSLTVFVPFVSSAEGSIDDDIITIMVPTVIGPDGEYLLPWETNIEHYDANEGVFNAAQYNAGHEVEVAVRVIVPNSNIKLYENEISLFTDGTLLYVQTQEKCQLPQIFDEDTNYSIQSSAPWRFVRFEVRDLDDTRIFYGDVQVAAQVIAGGGLVAVFNERDRTGTFPHGHSDLHLTQHPTVNNNNTANPSVSANFSVTRHNNSVVTFSVTMVLNSSGYIGVIIFSSIPGLQVG